MGMQIEVEGEVELFVELTDELLDMIGGGVAIIGALG